MSWRVRKLGDVERDHILLVMWAVDGKAELAARLLGIHIKTLRHKLKAYRDEDEHIIPTSKLCKELNALRAHEWIRL